MYSHILLRACTKRTHSSSLSLYLSSLITSFITPAFTSPLTQVEAIAGEAEKEACRMADRDINIVDIERVIRDLEMEIAEANGEDDSHGGGGESKGDSSGGGRGSTENGASLKLYYQGVVDVLRELNETVVGLDSVKRSTASFVNGFIRSKRNPGGEGGEDNNKAVSFGFTNLVFSGPPGVGKTMCARIVAKLLAALGIISKEATAHANGGVVEITKADLTAPHKGGTEHQVAKKLNEILQQGAVAFWDEAYELADGYGAQVATTLCAFLDKHKASFVMIIAGYEKQLKDKVCATDDR